MNLKKFTRIAVVVLFIVVILISFALRFAFKTVSQLITSGVKQVSELISVTDSSVSIADYITIDSSGIYIGSDKAPLLSSTGELGDSFDGLDVTLSDFSQHRYSFDPKLNRALDISVSDCDIVIASSDTEEIIVDLLESEDFKYTLLTSDNTLVIRDSQPEGEKKAVNIFGYELSFGSIEHEKHYTGLGMVIYLPKDFSGELEISTSNGDVKLGMLELDEALTISTTNGSILLSSISAYEITASTTNKRLSLSDISATELSVSTSNARIELSDLTAKRMTATTTNASIDFSQLFGEKFTFKTSNGDIDGSILGVQSLFSLDMSTDRTAYPESVDDPRAQYRLSAATTCGDIHIDFVE